MKKSKIYSDSIEQGALDQYNSAMELPEVVQGALMPDAHFGYTLPIGAVIATEDMVYPSWVGYDIGCGMCALRLDGVMENIVQFKREIFNAIYNVIPVGFHKNAVATDYDIHGLTNAGSQIAEKKSFCNALGTLGSGNHFIEIGSDLDRKPWIIIHSGSRGVGHGIATHYMREASGDGKVREGHHGFRTTSQLGKDYIQDLNWCLDYALANRKIMMARILNAINSVGSSEFEADWDQLINRNHNHAILEDGLWVHRKGATHAKVGMHGVIPGNMRDGSFIVIGKGNPDSLQSSSHGAGRVLGRKQAKRVLSLSDFTAEMDGIQAKVDADTLDESPNAYKDIFDVMVKQSDLVEIVNHVKPIINVKG